MPGGRTTGNIECTVHLFPSGQDNKTILQCRGGGENSRVRISKPDKNLCNVENKLIMSLSFINQAEKQLEENRVKQVLINWAYATNITDHNEKIKLDYQVRKIAMTIPDII